MDAASKKEVMDQLMKFLSTFWVPGAEVLLGFVLGPKIKKLILRMSAKSHNKSIMTFLGSCANILIIGIAIIMAAEASGVKMNSVIALLSALGLGISLALKSNMANVAGGLQILLTKPFTVGDFVEISGYQGEVTSVELMFSTLLTEDQVEVVLPNANIVSDTIVNYSRMPLIRLSIPFSAPAGSDMNAVSEQALEILKAFKPDDSTMPPAINVDSMNEGSITFNAIVYCKWQTCQKTEAAIKKALASSLQIYNASDASVNSVEITNLSQLTDTLARPVAPALPASSAPLPDVPPIAEPAKNSVPAADPAADSVHSIETSSFQADLPESSHAASVSEAANTPDASGTLDLSTKEAASPSASSAKSLSK